MHTSTSDCNDAYGVIASAHPTLLLRPLLALLFVVDSWFLPSRCITEGVILLRDSFTWQHFCNAERLGVGHTLDCVAGQ
jgi:hypothetical protein